MRKLRGILLVDDNETSNFLNERLLKRMALTDNIIILNNGKQALEYMEELSRQPATLKPELVLLDINMPVLDGFEFLELFNQFDEQFREDILISILSTSNHPQDTGKATRFNAHYLTKPLTTEKIENLLAAHYPVST